MDEEIKKRFAALEAKIAALEARDKKIEADVIHYIEQHGDHHHEMDRLTYEAYFETHPGYRESMDQYHRLVGGKSGGDADPKD